MEIKQNVNIHNRFDIEVRNIETGEVKSFGAENLITDYMWPVLCAGNNYFNSIVFGSGNGVPSADRKTLFVPITSKTASDTEIIKAVPVSSWKRQIVLGLTEYVGSSITEVGIGTTSTIYTHAMLKDSEGNPVSILKTDLDIVTIYATVFITIGSNNVELVDLPNSNALLNYLVGGSSFASAFFQLGRENGSELSSTTSSSFISDVANRKRKTNIARFATTVMYPYADYLNVQGLFRIPFRIISGFIGHTFQNVLLGVGDGVRRSWVLPSTHIKTIEIFVNGGRVNNFIEIPWCSSEYQRLKNPSILPGGAGFGVSLTPDGLIMTVAHDGSPYITTYDWVEGAWVKRPNPSSLPGGEGRGVALTPDGLIMAVAHVASPFITTYDWVEGAWVKRPNPSSLPASNGRRVALSADGLIMAVAHDNSPYITTYDWVDGAWVRRPTPSSLPPSTGYGVALTPDGLIMAVAHDGSPYITTYDWDDGAWVKRPNPSILPGGAGFGVALTPDGLIMAVAHGTSPFITTYDWVEGAWVKRPNPTSLPTGTGNGVALTPDGAVMVVAHNNSPYITTYDWVDGAWVRRPTPSSLPASTSRGVALTPDGLIMAVAYTNSPFITTYDSRGIKITFDTPPREGHAITANYVVDGIHKTKDFVVDVSCAVQFGEGI